MPRKKWQIVLAGTGGQGLILAGVVLAKAAIREGKKAVQTQTYGIQTRGGYSQAEVVIGVEDIYFPKCDAPHLVLALSRAAYQRYYQTVSDHCLILYDAKLDIPSPRFKDQGYPFHAEAMNLGNEKVVNSLALGAIAKLCPIVDKSSIAQVLKETLPLKVIELNLRALDWGFNSLAVKTML